MVGIRRHDKVPGKHDFDRTKASRIRGRKSDWLAN
jgi:hypothetical protein